MPKSRYIIGTLPWYGVLIVLGMCLAILLATKEERRLGLKRDTVLDLALWLLPMGVIGARIYYVVFAWELFADNPWRVFAIWNGGLAIYGGIIGGALAVVLFAHRRRLPVLQLMDIVVPGVALAQGIGRWGNFFNMEAYGAEITSTAWQFFPAGVLIPEGERLVWHQATFFYESVLDLTIFAVLWLSRRKMRKTGDSFFWYLLLYGAGRLVIEGLRTDSLMSLGGGLRVSQLLSGLLACVALAVFALRATGKKALCATLAALCAAGLIALWALAFVVPFAVCAGYGLLLAAAGAVCYLAGNPART